jgi:hypothetical protein
MVGKTQGATMFFNSTELSSSSRNTPKPTHLAGRLCDFATFDRDGMLDSSGHPPRACVVVTSNADGSMNNAMQPTRSGNV